MHFLQWLFFVFVSTTYNSLLAQNIISPLWYWTFNQGVTNIDSMQNSNLNFNYFNSQYNVVDGQVGNAIELSSNSNMIIGGQLQADSNIVVEFLFKPGTGFNQAQMFSRYDGAISIAMSYPIINFNTKHTKFTGGIQADNFTISLEGVNRKSYSYYTDGNWHHMVFKFNVALGKKEIWVDGALANGFSTTVTPGIVNNNGVLDFYISSTTSYYRYYGSFDEVAVYNKDLPNKLIYKHYLQVQQGLPYSFVNDYSATVPSAPAVNAGINIGEYAPGHPNVNVDFLTQLKNFPAPRYKRGHSMKQNFQWINPEFASGRFQPGISYLEAVGNSVVLQKELADIYNYSVLVSENTGYYGDYNNLNSFPGAWVNLANQNPQYKAAAISFWPQLRPSLAGYSSQGPYANNQNKPNSHYIRNNSGGYLNPSGGTGTFKYWSPASPLDSVVQDGQTQKFYLQQLLSALTRPLNHLNENGEMLPYYTESTMLQDPDVVADKNNSGFNDYFTYYGNRVYRFTNKYKSEFSNLLQQEGTYFSVYATDGYNNYRAKYSEMRNILTLHNGQKYPTPDFYPRYPSYWKEVPGAWHGMQWIWDCRLNEIAEGDHLYSPFVAAGWELDEEVNIRPAQWLGLLKLLGATGAEFYYSAFFNINASYEPPNPAPAHPNNYIWQEVIPAYSQAISSRYENLMRNSTLMDGDETNKFTNSLPGYRYKTGDISKIVCARKHNTANQYIIAGAIEQMNNMQGSAPDESTVAINFENQPLKFKIRRQGSVYYYDNTNIAAPIFYQLDEWHENKHPYFWSKDFEIQAELFDNISAQAQIKTTVPNTAAPGDFTNYTTTVVYGNGTTPTPLEYDINVRDSVATYYVWVRMRSRTGATTGATIWMDNTTARNIGCVSATEYHWYRIDSTSKQPIKYAGVTRGLHTIKLLPFNNAIEVDEIVLMKDGSTILDTYITTCSGPVTPATITAGGPLTFCSGGSVVLTANVGLGYIWSNGASTASITVNAAATYTVTVTNSNGTTASASVAVSVLPRPATPAIFTDYVFGAYSLNAQQPYATAYMWSNGATDRTIAVATTGSYSVQVSDDNCYSLPGTVNIASVAPKPCSVPDMLAAHDITSNSAIINWNGAVTADSFVVIYYADFTNVLYIRTAPGFKNEVRLINLLPAKGYKVTVIAKCGTMSYYSQRLSFSTLAGNLLCNATPHDLLETNIQYYAADLSWFASQADSLELRYKIAGGNNYVIRKLAANTTSCNVGPLLSNKEYTWNIRAYCNGIPTSYSFDKNFITQSTSALCSAPTNLYVNNATNTTAEIMWDNNVVADSVVLKYKENGNIGYKYKRSKANPNTGVMTLKNLTALTAYRVEAKYICGSVSSDWTSPVFFTTTSSARVGDVPKEKNQYDTPVSVFPNPASNSVSYSFVSDDEVPTRIKISNTLGHVLFANQFVCASGANNREVNIEGWATGIYVVECTVGETVNRILLYVY